MAIINKIPRGLRVLLTMAILATLVWRLAAGTDFYYYAIGAAVLLTAGVILATYRRPSAPKAKPAKKKNQKAQAGTSENEEPQALTDDLPSGEESAEIIHSETDSTDNPAGQRGMQIGGIKADKGTLARGSQVELTDKVDKITPEEVPVEPPIPLIEDDTTLSEEERNELVNAVWYRCENPYCKYTHFLGVHHIVDEKEGGTNKLDNLIVLCPYCHDLAHRGEVPENQMREWTGSREERFKFKPKWRYFK